MYSQTLIDNLNVAIESHFPHISKIEKGMNTSRAGVQRLVMLDRYSLKDTEKLTLAVGDFVVLTIKEDPKWPVRGFGYVHKINGNKAVIEVEEEFKSAIEDPQEQETGLVTRNFDSFDKVLELYYEQIAKRNARGLSLVEPANVRSEIQTAYEEELASGRFIPAGRVLYGAGSGAQVTYFNCYVMPFVADSREGIAEHRKQVMEIMSRGGGVGTNGTTLRPKNAPAKGVNGKSSGSVSWLDDIAKLTHLVEQGGSRRGAQMIMLSDSHPDIIEFIISKMQNPTILRYLIENSQDEQIVEEAKNKLKFTPLTDVETEMYQGILKGNFKSAAKKKAKDLLKDGGTYSVHNPDFLTGANISVTITKDFMAAVENDEDFALRFPDLASYGVEEMKIYNELWPEVGDVREWEALGYKVKTYRTIKAKELWNLINICSTYSAEPGIFFIDNANDMTNAKAYGQKVVATNPCGEQPLAPYSVCNLAAVNLAEMADKESGTVNFEQLRKTVEIGVRMQDNVIDSTPYFLEANEKQALGERRVGLGVMGLHDLLIYCGERYGSTSGNKLVDKVFETIAVTAYKTSIKLAKEKGSFPFLVGETEKETMELRNKFINTGFMKKMPEDVRQSVLKDGIRNSHLLTIAPTGSTGTMVNVSTGLEPYFSFSYFRSGRLGKNIEVKADIVQEYLDKHPEAEGQLPDFFVTAMELTAEEHADVQCIIQRWIDSSISKTVNAPKGYTVEQVQAVYERLYKGGAKGGTVYVDGSRESQVLTLTTDENTFDDSELLTTDENTFDSDTPLYDTTISYVDEAKEGSNIGDICPNCHVGEVRDIGGCNTCDNCGIQLKCGL
ncbi:vitamin B12-dependent ribonucleotide reductase [[Brevibacterium] frigoritolerans]|nr:vitamin B12-dependent ribonucleotide reductase [Peribacillus frigoritolerans]